MPSLVPDHQRTRSHALRHSAFDMCVAGSQSAMQLASVSPPLGGMIASDETLGMLVLRAGGAATRSHVRRHSVFDICIAGSQCAMQSSGAGMVALETLGRIVPSGGASGAGAGRLIPPTDRSTGGLGCASSDKAVVGAVTTARVITASQQDPIFIKCSMIPFN